MIQQMAGVAARAFSRRDIIPRDDEEIYAFGFECMISAGLQAVILLVLGLVLGALPETVLFTGGFTGIKKHIGGWHADTHLACLSFSTLMTLCAVLLGRRVPGWGALICLGAALILVFLLAPIQHINNPKTNEELVLLKKKARTISLVLAFGTTVCFCIFGQIAAHAALGLLAAALTLLIPNKKGV